MNKQPVAYLQTDARWKDRPYRNKPTEKSTIGGAGCGPTCAAMVIATLRDKSVTPVETCEWAVANGHKAGDGQGTRYGSYFQEQLKAYGISCYMLSWTNTYHRPSHVNHKKALNLIKQGYYAIALMKKGLWTSGGHFVLVWWANGKIHINDPASTRAERTIGRKDTFTNEVAYYWVVDARAYNNGEDDDDMDLDKLIEQMTPEQAKRIADKAAPAPRTTPAPWAEADWEKARQAGVLDGTDPGGQVTREMLAVVLARLGLTKGG